MPKRRKAQLNDAQDHLELALIIETPKRSRNKFKFDEESGRYKLSKVLPQGMYFPYDFGFIPDTKAPDGDPLDVLLLMDEPTFPGCEVPARLIGVIEARQRSEGETTRNDRLIAVSTGSPDHGSIQHIDDLDDNVLRGIEEFFRAYQHFEGGSFEPLARRGPARAKAILARMKKTHVQQKIGIEQLQADVGELAKERSTMMPAPKARLVDRVVDDLERFTATKRRSAS